MADDIDIEEHDVMNLACQLYQSVYAIEDYTSEGTLQRLTPPPIFEADLFNSTDYQLETDVKVERVTIVDDELKKNMTANIDNAEVDTAKTYTALNNVMLGQSHVYKPDVVSVDDTEKELVTDPDSKNVDTVTVTSASIDTRDYNNGETCGLDNVDITDVISESKDEANKDKRKAKNEASKNTVERADKTKAVPKVQSRPLQKVHRGHSFVSPLRTRKRITILFNDDQYCTIKNYLVPEYKRPEKMRKKIVQKEKAKKRPFKYGSDKVQKSAQEIAKIVSAGVTLEDVLYALLPMETYCDKCKKLFFRKSSFNRHSRNSHGYLITNDVAEETGDEAEMIAKKLGISLETKGLESNVIDDKEILDDGEDVSDDGDAAEHRDYESDVDVETATDELRQDVHSKVIPETVFNTKASVSEHLVKSKLVFDEVQSVQGKNKAVSETATAEPKQVFRNKLILGSVARKSTTKSHTEKPEVSDKKYQNVKETVTKKRDKLINVGNNTVAANIVRNKSEPFHNNTKDSFHSDNTAEPEVHKKSVHDVINSAENNALVATKNVMDKLYLTPVVYLEDIKYLLQSAKKHSEPGPSDELVSKSIDCDERELHNRRRIGFEINSNFIGKKIKYSEFMCDTRSATTGDKGLQINVKDQGKVASVKAKIDNSNSKFKGKFAPSPVSGVQRRIESKATKSNGTDNDGSDVTPKENPNGRNIQCLHCNKYYETKDQLINHMYEVLNEKAFKCQQCNENFANETSLQQHIEEIHKKKATQSIKNPSNINDVVKNRELVSDQMDDLEQNQSLKEPTEIERTKSEDTAKIEMRKELTEENEKNFEINDREQVVAKSQEKESSCNNNKEFDDINNAKDSLTIEQRAVLQILRLCKRQKQKQKPKKKTGESELLLNIYKKTKQWRNVKKKKQTKKAHKVNNNAPRQVPKSEVKVYPGRRAAFKSRTENLSAQHSQKVTDVQEENSTSCQKSGGNKRHGSKGNQFGKACKSKRNLSPAPQVTLAEQMSQLNMSQLKPISTDRSDNHLIKDCTSLAEQVDTKEEIVDKDSSTTDLEGLKLSSIQLPVPLLMKDNWSSDTDMANAEIKNEDTELEEHTMAEIENEDIGIEDTTSREQLSPKHGEDKRENVIKDRTDELEEILDTKTNREVKIAVILDTTSDDEVETPNLDKYASKIRKRMKRDAENTKKIQELNRLVEELTKNVLEDDIDATARDREIATPDDLTEKETNTKIKDKKDQKRANRTKQITDKTLEDICPPLAEKFKVQDSLLFVCGTCAVCFVKCTAAQEHFTKCSLGENLSNYSKLCRDCDKPIALTDEIHHSVQHETCRTPFTLIPVKDDKVIHRMLFLCKVCKIYYTERRLETHRCETVNHRRRKMFCKTCLVFIDTEMTDHKKWHTVFKKSEFKCVFPRSATGQGAQPGC